MFTILHLDHTVFKMAAPRSGSFTWDAAIEQAEHAALGQMRVPSQPYDAALLRLSPAARFARLASAGAQPTQGGESDFLRLRYEALYRGTATVRPRLTAGLRRIFPKPPVPMVDGAYRPPHPDQVAVAAVVTQHPCACMHLVLHRAGLGLEIPERMVFGPEKLKNPDEIPENDALKRLLALAITHSDGEKGKITLISDQNAGIDAGNELGIGRCIRYYPRSLNVEMPHDGTSHVLRSWRGFSLK